MISENFLEAQKFFSLVTGEKLPKITYQLFLENEDGGGYHFTRSLSEGLFKDLEKKNDNGFGVYWMVNEGDGRGRDTSSVKRVRALFVDLDGSPLEPVLPYNPHLVVQSSERKYHCYWFCEGFELNQFRNLQKHLAHLFGGDTKVHDLPRVLRVPGFLNKKAEYNTPFRVKVLMDNSSLPRITPKTYKLTFPPLSGFLKIKKPKKHKAKAIEYTTPEYKDLQEALKFIPAEDYETLIMIGMGLKKWNPVQGFDLWNEWSSKSVKYNPNQMEGKWNSFRREGITVSSIFWMAQEAGYIQKSPIPIIKHDYPVGFVPRATATNTSRGFLESVEPMPVDLKTKVINEAPKLKSHKKKKPPKGKTLLFPSELAETAPGIVGKLTNWITNCGVQKRPTLSLAAAISLISVLKAHRVQTETGLRTNFYVLGLAKSGTGKNHPLQACSKVLELIGQQDIISGRPASDGGLLKSLEARRGRSLVVWDEFGMDLQLLTGDRASPHSKSIVRCLMELFTFAGGTYLGTERANSDGRKPTLKIEQPCLSIFGTSTPSTFYEGLSSSYAASGFLPRWLVLESDNKRQRKNLRQKANLVPPTDLLHDLNGILNMPVNCAPTGQNVTDALAINPKIVEFTDSAFTRLEALDEEFSDYSEATEENLASLWTRGTELTQKLALVVSDGDKIGERELIWSSKVVRHCLSGLVEAVSQRVGDTQIEKESKRIVSIIRDAGVKGISRSKLTQKTRFLDPRKRNSLLNDLVQSGVVENAINDSNGGRPVENFILKSYLD